MFKSFNCLELKRSEYEGRYIIATRDIDIGEDILKVKSYFAITCDDFKKTSCYNCIKLIKVQQQQQSQQQPQQQSNPQIITIQQPIKCNECNEVWYCSDKCKSENQPKHLHYECKHFKKFRSPKLRIDPIKKTRYDFDADAFSEIRIIVGLLSRYYQDILLNNKYKEGDGAEGDDGGDGTYIKDTLDGVFDLVENEINEVTNNAAKELIDSIHSFIILLFEEEEEKEDILKKIILQIRPLISKVRCNQFGIWTKTDKCIGMAVSPSSSYFNHSCIPNCESVRNGSDMTFKSLYPILKGEKISISYLSLDKSTKRRKEYLKYGYYFNCNCPRCKSNDDNNKLLEDQLDNWISKFYCHQKKCTGLYYSKDKFNINNNNNNNNNTSITLSCSTCDDQLTVNSCFYDNKPNF